MLQQHPPCGWLHSRHRAHLTASARGLSTKQAQAPGGAEQDLLHGDSSRTTFASWLESHRALRTTQAPGREISALLFDKEGRNLSPGHSFCPPTPALPYSGWPRAQPPSSELEQLWDSLQNRRALRSTSWGCWVGLGLFSLESRQKSAPASKQGARAGTRDKGVLFCFGFFADGEAEEQGQHAVRITHWDQQRSLLHADD